MLPKLAKAFGYSLPLDGPAYAVIWTTTPWTIPANQALNVHPDITYALVRRDARLFRAGRGPGGRAASSVTSAQARLSRLLKERRSSDLEFRHPFGYDRAAPVYLAEFVTLEQGTGIVHSSPAYGVDDF